jgi:hypothetical protein
VSMPQICRMVVLCAAILCFIGCRDNSLPQSDIGMRMDKTHISAMSTLTNQTGIGVSSNTMVIRELPGGNRNPGSVIWIIQSTAEIQLPLPTNPEVSEDYLELPVGEAVDSIRSFMNDVQIFEPRSAYFARWRKNGYTYGGTVVRSGRGDYLLLMQNNN